MPRFTYVAYDVSGGKLVGDIDGSDIDQVKTQLTSQQLLIVDIKEQVASLGASSIFGNRSVSAVEMEYFTAELALLLKAGVTIDKALGITRRNTSSSAQAIVIAQLHDSVRRGDSLADAMQAQDQLFNPLYLNLVRLGEVSGTLSEVFARLAEDLKFQNELKRQVIQALIYPGVIFSVCMACILFVFNYIVPQMRGLFDGIPELPFYTSALLGISEWVGNYQWYMLFGLLAIVSGISFMYRNTVGASFVDAFMVRVPGLSNMLLRIERIRFNTALALMLQSGLLIDQCLEMAVGSVKNRELRRGLIAAKDRVKKGSSLVDALRSSPVFDDFSMSLIEVGEESGELSPVFIEISDRSRREFQSAVDRMTSLLEPLLILTMGVIVGGVVVTMLLSIVSVNDVGY